MTDRNDTLTRLLGPASPELGCDDCFRLLDVYVELEHQGRVSDLPEAAEMSAHLEGCPACHEEHDSLLALVSAS